MFQRPQCALALRPVHFCWSLKSVLVLFLIIISTCTRNQVMTYTNTIKLDVSDMCSCILIATAASIELCPM